jgi:hypothetical protein
LKGWRSAGRHAYGVKMCSKRIFGKFLFCALWGALLLSGAGHVDADNGTETKRYEPSDQAEPCEVSVIRLNFDGSYIKEWLSDDGIIYTAEKGARYFFSDRKLIKIAIGELSVVTFPTLNFLELSLATISPCDTEIYIIWTLKSEFNTAGFNLYRDEPDEGRYVAVNDEMVKAIGGPGDERTYVFVDYDVGDHETYSYKLEVVGVTGEPTVHGPLKATPAGE